MQSELYVDPVGTIHIRRPRPILDSQNGWYEFAVHACEQQRFLREIVLPLTEDDQEIDAQDHYWDMGVLLPQAGGHSGYAVKELRRHPKSEELKSEGSESEEEEYDKDYVKRSFADALDFYKGEGFRDLHRAVGVRQMSVTEQEAENMQDASSFDLEDLDSLAHIMLKTMLDLPRLTKAFLCYRSIDRIIEREARRLPREAEDTADRFLSQFETTVERYTAEFEAQYVADNYHVGQIVPIHFFLSVGMIVGEEDSFNLPDRGVVLRITVPAMYPHYCFYQDGGQHNLENSEVLLAYTASGHDDMLTHGMRVNGIYWSAQIGVSGRRKTAVIDVEIVPLQQPIPLRHSRSAAHDDFVSFEYARATQPAFETMAAAYDELVRTEVCIPLQSVRMPERWRLLFGTTRMKRVAKPPTMGENEPSEHEIIQSSKIAKTDEED